MRIHFISDIHLEKALSHFPLFSRNARTAAVPLFLAGDIGNVNNPKYFEFLDIAANCYQHVYLITGNHEYDLQHTEEDFQNVDAKTEKLAAQIGNITFLNRKCLKRDKYWVAGCTLWTKQHHRITQRIMTQNERHSIDSNFLFKVIEEAKKEEMPLIVLTHHLPSHKLIAPQFSAYLNKSNWASHSEHLLVEPTKVWICGHSHISYDGMINNVRILINAKNRTIKETRILL